LKNFFFREADVFSGTIGLKRFSKGEDIAPIQIAKIEDIAWHITALTQKVVDEGQVISDVRDSRCYPYSS
jgi:hypothetical protein